MKKNILLLLVLMMFAGVVRANYWNVENLGSYEDYSTVTAVVNINGIEQTSTQLELGAFCNGVVRGSVYAVKYKERYLFRLKCYGNSGDKFSLRLYDAEHEIELNNLECDFIVNYGESLGSPTNPQVIEFNSVVSTYELPITGYGSNPGGYYLIASPVTVDPSTVEDPEANVGMTEDPFDLYYFDDSQHSEEWQNWEANHFNLVPGKGYLYAHQTGGTFQLSGELYEGDGIFPLQYSDETVQPNEDLRGWNLVGNPFTTTATIDYDCYVMSTERNEIIASSSHSVAAMEGVFVKANGAGESVTFSTTAVNNKAKLILNVLRGRGATIDRAIVNLEGNSNLPKFMLNPESTKIFIQQEGKDYAVVSSNENEIPVSFKAANNGTYTLNVAVQNAEMEYLHLIDNLTGTDVDLLATPSYTFEAAKTDNADRFTLVMSNTTSIDEHFAFFNGHNWTVSSQGEANLQVIDMTGRVVSNKTIDGTTQLDIDAASGVYMFRLVNGSDVKVQKVVVR